MLLDELLVKIGVNADDKDAKKLDFSLKNLAKTVLGLDAAFSITVAGIAAFVNSSLTALDDIAQLSRVTGEAASEIQALGKIAEVNGSSTQAAQSSIAGLSKVIGEAASNFGRGAKAFEEYGFSAKKANGQTKSSLEMMSEISQKMEGMSNQQQISMLSKLGIDASMIQTLRLSREEMAAAVEEAKALSLETADGADTAADFKDSMTQMGQIMKAVFEFIALRLAPIIKSLNDRFKAFFITNNKLIREGLSKLAQVLGWIIKFIVGLTKATSNVISNTIGWKAAIMLLGGAFLYLTRGIQKSMLAFAASPIGLAIIAITGLMLLIDDFITYMQGGESLFGDYWEPLAKGVRWVQRELESLQPTFDAIKEWVMVSINYAKEMFWGLVDIVKGVWDLIVGIVTLDSKKIAQGLFKIWNGILRFFSNWWENVKNLFSGAVTALGVIWDAVWGFISAPYRKAFDWVSQKWEDFKAKFEIAPFSTIFDGVIDFITAPFRFAFDVVAELWQLLTGQQLNLSVIKDGFKAVTDWITEPFKAAFEWVSKQYDKYIQPIIDGVKNLKFWGDDEASSKVLGAGSDNMLKSMQQLATINLLPQSAVAGGAPIDNSRHIENKPTITVNVTDQGNAQMNGKIIADAAARAVVNSQSDIKM